ncbi:MAG TPA: hypothetical protein VKY19_18025 [Ktedonosporobacter sp.]|jgi:hypothetical protein|nr:hypothetical protein [Ktedonosporobacter sp.]
MAILKPSAIDWERASWEEACQAVEQFTDKLGLGIDPGIFETVVALNLLRIQTVQSCEGHLDHGYAYPWITVVDAERKRLLTREWSHICALEDQAKTVGTPEAYNQYLSADIRLRVTIMQWERNDPLFCRLTTLLDAFYAEQKIPPSPSRLLIERLKFPGTYRIVPGFSLALDELPEHLKASYLTPGQAEMQAFTRFLKRQWQKEQEKRESIS